MQLPVAPSFGVLCVVRFASYTNFNEPVGGRKSEREPAKPLKTKKKTRTHTLFFLFLPRYFSSFS